MIEKLLKLHRKLFFSTVFSVLLFAVFAFVSYANVDPSKECSLEIIYHDSEKKLSNVDFDLYRVGDISTVGKYSLSEKYAEYPVDLNAQTQDDWRLIADTLKGYIDLDKVEPDYSGKTDKDGEIQFVRLPVGLYLVSGAVVSRGSTVYYPTTYLVSLPNLYELGGDWVYDVTSEPKLTTKTIHSPSSGGSTYVTYRVVKAWNDYGAEENRPDYVELTLLRNGQIYETLRLTQADNWRHSWTNLDYSSAWSVVETPVAGYTTVFDVGQSAAVITNTYIGEPVPDKKPGEELPQTGLPYAAVIMLILAAGITLIMSGYKKNSNK